MRSPIFNSLGTFLLTVWFAFSLFAGEFSFANAANTTANSKHIKTSSLLTCMVNSQFSSTFFDVKFYPGNKTVVFNIDATTTISEKIVAKVELIAYGLNILEESIDLCTLNEKTICPLSAGRIDVHSSYTINNNIVDRIPGIAYTIPDLDAQVRVVAYAQNDEGFETPLACVQAVLSNDKTVQTKYASWPIAAISGLGVLTSGFVSVIGHSTTAAHIASNSISLFVYFQNLAITSMMAVSKVPPIAAAWAQNFQWSMGIINAKFMQDALHWYVQATGGTSTVVVANKDILSIAVQKKKLKRAFIEGAKHLVKRVSVSSSDENNFDKIFSDNSLYTTTERNSTEFSSKILVLHGIQRVSYMAGIELSNFFLTGIVFFLFFVFVVIVCLIFFKALVEVLTRARVMTESSKFFEYRKSWGNIIKGTLFRLSIIAFPQVSILTIWEFTQRDSAATLVSAIVILAVVFGLLLYGVVRVTLRARESVRMYKTPAYLLYGDSNFLNRFGFLYVQFKADMYWWLIPLLTYAFFRSLFVAVLQNEGKAQAMIIFVIELAYFIALCWARPYLDKRTNAFNIAIHLINFLNSLFFLFFSNLFKQPPVVSSVMAIVLFVLNAVFALFLLIFTIVTCTLALLHRNPDARYQPMKDDRVSFIPKIQTGGNASKSETELFDLGKAVMVTNETENEKQKRNSAFGQQQNGSNRLLFDDDVDETSTYEGTSASNRTRSYTDNAEPQPLQPTSAVLGPSSLGGNGGYQKVPSAPSSGYASNNLRKPENTFNNNTSYQGYSSPNPYSSNPYAQNNGSYV